MAKFEVGDEVKVIRSKNKHVAEEQLGKYGVILERKRYKIDVDSHYYNVKLHFDETIILFADEIELVIPEPPYNSEALHRWLST